MSDQFSVNKYKRYAKCIMCPSNQERDRVKFHTLPINFNRARAWLQVAGVNYNDETIQQRRHYLFFCERHFHENDYYNVQRTRLLPHAVPHCTTGIVQVHPEPEPLPSTSAEPSSVPLVNPERADESNESELSLDMLSSIPMTSESHDTALSATVSVRPVSGQRSVTRTYGGIVRKKDKEIKRLRKVAMKNKNEIKRLIQIIDNRSYLAANDIFKDLSSGAAILMAAQLRNKNRSAKGRRWTYEEKVACVSLFKKSPACYSLLRKMIPLPSKNTLLTFLSIVNFQTGVNAFIFEHLTKCVGEMKSRDRFCILLFDEMSIQEHIYYDSASDSIIGFEDLGHLGRTSNIANHALVFMVRGVCQDFKQPVAYYFEKNINAKTLALLIPEVLKAIEETGLKVLATVCDMGANNVKALKELGASFENPAFVCCERTISTIFDPPHLIKCTRNLFHKYLVEFDDGSEGTKKIARWDYVVQAYEKDKEREETFKLLPTLKKEHLDPKHRDLMRVSFATKVMSRSMFTAIYSLYDHSDPQSEVLATAEFVKMINDLFDSLNCREKTPKGQNVLSCLVTEDSEHWRFWTRIEQVLPNWSFNRKGSSYRSPSLKGWLATIQAVKNVWQEIKSSGVRMMTTARLNQDPLENLFGAVRSSCGSNRHPTVSQFKGALKTCVITGLATRSLKKTNCELDSCTVLSDLRSLFDVAVSSVNIPSESNINVQSSCNVSRIVNDGSLDLSLHKLEIFSVVCTAIVKFILRNISCDDCKCLIPDSSDHVIDIIRTHDYSAVNPLFELLADIRRAELFIMNNLKSEGHSDGIVRRLSQKLREEVYFTWLRCTDHSEIIKDRFLLSVCRMFIDIFCRKRNIALKKHRTH